MIPSRGEPVKLMRAIMSIYDSASSRDYEVIVWLDDDDEASLKILPELHKSGCRVFIGPPLGYDLLDRGYYTLCAYHAKAPWVWIFNTDMCVSGDWLEELKSVPRVDNFCQPEVHKLGNSIYPKDNRTGCPIFRWGSWLVAGWHTIPAKADYVLTAKLEEMGWSCHFLPGVTVWHDREK